MKRIAAVLLLAASSIAALAQATIPVTGQKVVDNNLQPLTGQLVFTVTDGSDNPITYTPLGGSPTNATITIPVVKGAVQNVGGFPAQIPNPSTMSPSGSFFRMQVKTGATTVFTFPETNITQAFFSYDGYLVPATVTASGIGIPKLPCNPHAQFTNTAASDPYPWVCSQFTGDNSVYWTQNPSLSPACQRGNNQAIASSLAGQLFCVDSSQAFVTPGFVWAGPPSAHGPSQIGLVSLSALCANSACGAGGGFTGQSFEINAKSSSGTSGVGTGFFTDANKDFLTTNVPFTALTTNGNTNTDLDGGIPAAIADCDSAPCNLETANGSPDATVITQVADGGNPAQWTHIDHRLGLNFTTAQNVFAQSDNNLTQITPLGGSCYYGQTGIPGQQLGTSVFTCSSANMFKTGGGISVDGHWTNVAAIGGQGWFNTRGQSYRLNFNDNFNKAGDSIEDERTMQYREACIGGSDECAKFFAWHFQEIGTQFGTIGTGSSARGGTIITLTPGFSFESAGFIEDSAFLIDTDEPAAVQGYQFDSCVSSPDQIIPELCHTTSSHAVSTWQATLVSSPCGTDDIRDSKVTNPTGHLATCTVNVTSVSAAPTVGSVVTFADADKYESARVTAYAPNDNLTGTHTITLSLTLAHTSAGTLLMQGGTAGNIVIFAPPGVSDPSTTPGLVISAFPSGGSPDATHEYLITNLQQGESGVQNIRPPVAPIESTANALISCSGGVVQVANQFGGQLDMLLNITPVGSQQWVVSGNSSASMNGVVTNVHMNSSGFGLTGSWTAPGGTCGSGVGSGGTITLTHSADVFEYCGAEVIANASGTTFQNSLRPNGLIHLDDNNCLFATGSRVMQPNRVESVATPYVDLAHGQTQSLNGTGGWGNHEIGGMSYSGQYLDTWETDDNPACPGGDFYGCGGANLGHGVADYNMPMDGWLFNDGLIPGGVLFTIKCPLIGCSSTMPDTPLFTLPNGGSIIWHGAGSQLQLFGGVLFENGWESAGNTVLDPAIQMTFQSFEGAPMAWGECNPFAAGEKWCWGTNPRSGTAQDGSIETGNVQVDVLHGLTALNSSGVQKPVCLLDGTDCPLATSLLTSNNLWSGTNNFQNTLSVAASVAATSSANQQSPAFNMIANVWNGSASIQDVWTWNNSAGIGANPPMVLTLSHTGSTGASAVSIPFGMTVGSINAMAGVQGVSIAAAATGMATSSANFPSSPLQVNAAYWNGTISSADSYGWTDVVGAGTNPTSVYTLSHSGSSGAASLSIPFPITITTLPATTNNTQAASTGYVKSITGMSNTATAAVGSGVTSVTCASATCTSTRGTYTVVGGTATTGTIATLTWTATSTIYVCQVSQNAGTALFGIGHGAATTTGLVVTAAASVSGATFAFDYECIP